MCVQKCTPPGSRLKEMVIVGLREKFSKKFSHSLKIPIFEQFTKMNADNSIATKYKKIEKPVGEGTYGVRASIFSCYSFSSFFAGVPAPRRGKSWFYFRFAFYFF